MSDVFSHKCPNCDGPLLFDPEKQSFHCEYCLSVFLPDDLDRPDQVEKHRHTQETKEQLFNLYTCPSCAAEIVTDETTAATFCYYCHNPVTLTDRISGDFLPNAMLPFNITESQAKAAFLEWTKSKIFVPKDFFTANQIEKMTGVYFPYWNVDAVITGSLKAKGTKIDIWRVGETEYTRTRTYRLFRKGRIAFRSLIKNALSKNTKQVMIESVLPFPVEEGIPFDSAFLAGFQAEKRDIEYRDIESQVRQELDRYTEAILKSDISGMTTVSVRDSQTQLVEQSNNYLLLPLWVVTYKDRQSQEPYYYAMNGVTGKISGKLPIHQPKLLAVSVGIGLVVAGLALLGGYVLF